MQTKITLTYRELRALLVPVIPHAGRDDMLPVLLNIPLTVVGDQVVAQATDRFTAAWRRITPAATPDPGFAVNLLATDAARLLSLLKPARGASAADGAVVELTDSGTGELTVTARSIEFAAGFIAITTELLGEGDYPDLNTLLPSSDEMRGAVPAAVFRAEWLSRFLPARKVCGNPDVKPRHRGLLFHMPVKPAKPLWVTVGTDPDFLGAQMPRRLGPPAEEWGAEGDVSAVTVDSWRGFVLKSKAARNAKAKKAATS